MKLAGFILAFYLIFLSAVPCCEYDDKPDDKTEQSANHESKDQDCGNCSPFFGCEGCAAATIIFEPARLGIVAIKIPKVYSAYIQTALPNVDFDFWKPPKTG